MVTQYHERSEITMGSDLWFPMENSSIRPSLVATKSGEIEGAKINILFNFEK